MAPEYYNALRKADAFPLTEDEKRRRALEFQAKIQGNVTQGSGQAGTGVIPAPGALPSAAKGVGAGAEGGQKGQKNRGPSAAARAPEAEAGASIQTEPKKTKPNRRENEFMLNLMILRNTLRTNAPACRDRARLAGKWIWRDIRLMLTLVDRIQNAMLRTMPDSRDEYYSAYARHGHYELHIDGPVRTARHLLVTDRHLAAMAEAAMKSECILCMREGSEIGQCELREALLEAAAPTAIQEGNSLFRKCEYREAAGQLVQGKDVTV
jgi:hypothetical protein